MRRIDAILICLGCFVFGGGVYLGFKAFGIADLDAGIWSQVVLVLGLIGWIGSYGIRAITHNMTYDRQIKDHKEAYLRRQLEGMSEAEVEALMEEVESAKTKLVQANHGETQT
jgi:Protein of unknown function (DUF3007)